MAKSQIVGGGATLVSVSTVGHIPKVATLVPQTLNDSILEQASDGPVQYIRVGATAVQLGLQETFRTADGIISQQAGVNDSLKLGAGAVIGAGATGAIALGNAVSVGGVGGVVIGNGANGAGKGVVIGNAAVDLNPPASDGAVVIGTFASASALVAGSIIIGHNASATNTGDRIVIGRSATSGANGLQSGIAIGGSAQAIAVAPGGGGSNAIAIGAGANARAAPSGDSLAIGDAASAFNVSIAIGAFATTRDVGSGTEGNIAIGRSAVGGNVAGNIRNVVIGSNGGAKSGSNNVCLGHQAVVTGSDNVLIGSRTAFLAAGFTGSSCIIIGAGGSLAGAAPGNNHAMIGQSNTIINTVVIGEGDTVVSPAARNVRFTNASGNNNPAAGASLDAPRSTGNANAASLTLRIGEQVAGSSNVLQTLVNALVLSHSVTGGHRATFLGRVDTGASTTLGASLLIPAGVAPSSPASGELWYDGTNLRFRDGVTTRTITWT
jgi:hypothetical protein